MRAVCLVLLMLMITGCGAGGGPGRHAEQPAAGAKADSTPAGPEILAMQEAPVPIALQMAGKTGIVDLTITEGGFRPQIIPAKVGGQVRIHVRNAGTAAHNVIIPRYGIVTRTLGPGEESYVEFTAGEKGDWPLYSDAPGEPETSLVGTLKVE